MSAPPYNHTREDSALTPCDLCLDLRRQSGLPDTGARTTYPTGAIREADPDKPAVEGISPFAIVRLGILFAKGGKKYGDFRNWEKGIPVTRYIGGIIRHVFQYLARNTAEDHLAAIMWNAQCLIHHEEVGGVGGKTFAELDDRPVWGLVPAPVKVPARDACNKCGRYADDGVLLEHVDLNDRVFYWVCVDRTSCVSFQRAARPISICGYRFKDGPVCSAGQGHFGEAAHASAETCAAAHGEPPPGKVWCQRCDEIHDTLACGCPCQGNGACHTGCGCPCPPTCWCWRVEGHKERVAYKPAPGCSLCGVAPPDFVFGRKTNGTWSCGGPMESTYSAAACTARIKARAAAERHPTPSPCAVVGCTIGVGPGATHCVVHT